MPCTFHPQLSLLLQLEMGNHATDTMISARACRCHGMLFCILRAPRVQHLMHRTGALQNIQIRLEASRLTSPASRRCTYADIVLYSLCAACRAIETRSRAGKFRSGDDTIQEWRGRNILHFLRSILQPLFCVSAHSAQAKVALPAYGGTKRSHLNAQVLFCFGPVRLLETTPRAENALT